MNKIKDYIKNIDFELVDDDLMLDNVYNEIKGSEEKLIGDMEVSYNMEQLIKKSNVSQIIKLVKNIKIEQAINKKIGSRVFETIFTTLFDLSYKKKIEQEEVDDLKSSLLDPIYKNLTDILINRNGTFALRRYFEYVYGIKSNETRKKRSKTLFNGYEFKDKILTLLDKYFELEGLITILTYLKLDYRKRIARKIVDTNLTLESIKNPHFSFIFEDLIKIGDKKTVETISTFLENNFNELLNDKCANYVIARLIKEVPDKTDVYFSLADLSALNINSNFILRIFENFCKQGNIEKIKKILHDFYFIEDNESAFHKLLLSDSNGLNTKFIDAVVNLMDLEGDVCNINSDFVEQFDNAWLSKKAGITLIKAFLEGGATNKLKKKLISKITISPSLLKKKDGVKISNLCKTLKRTKS